MPNGGMTERDSFWCINPECKWRGENPIFHQTNYGEERGLKPPFCPSCGHSELERHTIGW